MTSVTAATAYKKVEGLLALSKDKKTVTWSPSTPGDASLPLKLDVMKIKQLQQTPAEAKKVMLKIFAEEVSQPQPVAHTFQFTSKSDPRAEANNFRDALSAAMSKASQEAIAQPTGSGLQSAAMTIAAAISGGKGAPWEDDEKLLGDVRLQQTLLRDNAELQKTFVEGKNMKPESLSLIQFTKQFWASRVHLLRAHALARSQSKGLYNVFSEIRRTDDGKKLNLTSEHIKAIFEQYPVMRIVYDEVVPKKIPDERDFWSRFFQSQLYSTLRGLKIDRRTEARDAIMDQYLDHPQITGARPTSAELHIPKFIDLEGNEENHSQRKGNLPDVENRQTNLEKGPIIRRLNAISERLMAAVRPSDVDASVPIGMDEHEYQQLRLRDLAEKEDQQHIALNIRDQSRFFSNNEASKEDIDVARIRALDPTNAIQKVCQDLDEHYSQPGRAPKVSTELDNEDDEMEDEDAQKAKSQLGSTIASNHMLKLITAHRDQYQDIANSSANAKSFGGLSESIYERLLLTQATTLEYLRQFWAAFLSGDPSRTGEVASLVESLNRALDRINAIADDAQEDRLAIIRKYEKQAAELYAKSGKKKKVDTKAVGGGEVVVKQLLGPTIKSLGVAVERYTQAYEEQMRELQQGEEDAR